MSTGKTSNCGASASVADLEEIAGYIWPGKGLANMVFVTFCYISSAQGKHSILTKHYIITSLIRLFQESSSRPT